MTKTIIKEKTIEECLQSLSQEEVNKLYEEIPEELKPKKKKITNQDKIDTIISEIISGYMVHCFMFTDEEEKQLDTLISGKIPKEISPKILDNNFIFKINNNYIVPQEIIDMNNFNKEQNLSNKRKNIAINFYLLSNGVLEITKLIELLKATGLNITKTELSKIAKENNYIISKNLIYLDDLAQNLDKSYRMHEQKKENIYREFSLEEIFAIQVQLESENYEEQIKKIILKKTKNKEHASKFAGFIRHMATIGYNYIENIEELLEVEEISLTEKDKEKLLDIANEIYRYFPNWELNGHSELELSSNEGSFEDLSEEEQLEAYIHTYLTLNGIIEIDKLLEILKTNHNLNITKKDLIKQVFNIEDLNLYNSYLCIDGVEELIDEMMPIKKMIKQYKIIDDIDEIVDQIWDITDRIIDLSLKYGLDEEVVAGLEQIMRMAGGITEEILQDILQEEGYKLSPKKLKELFKELSLIQKDVRIWSYNGFKKSELTNLNKKEKIGRNSNCPCGSGKKYKQCCGK